jgi:hypothetical protein
VLFGYLQERQLSSERQARQAGSVDYRGGALRVICELTQTGDRVSSGGIVSEDVSVIRQIIPVVLAATMLFAEAGCGTVRNLSSDTPEIPFGGVQKELDWYQNQPKNPGGGGDGIVILVEDLTLDAICDILTLPLALYIMHRK